MTQTYPDARFHLAFRDMGGINDGQYTFGIDPKVTVHITRIWKRIGRANSNEYSRVEYLWLEWLETETHEWLHAFMHRWKTGHWSNETKVEHGTQMIMKHLRDFWRSTSQTPFDPFDFYDYEQEDNIFV